MAAIYVLKIFKDTQKENIPSKKTQALTKSTNMDIWLIGILNLLFIRGFKFKFELN